MPEYRRAFQRDDVVRRVPPPASADRRFILAITLVALLGGLVAARHAFKPSIPFADTITYVEPGFNLLEGRGFVTRFNVVYGWSGSSSHPALGYYNPMYSLVVGALWHVLRDLAGFSLLVTVIPTILNAVLMARLALPVMGRLASVLSAVGYLIMPGTMANINQINAEGPTLTICLLMLLLMQNSEAQTAGRWFRVGGLLGIGCLIKTSLVMFPAGLCAAMFLNQAGGVGRRIRLTARSTAMLVTGMLAVLLPYSLACMAVTGTAYPEYPALARNWSLAVIYGGQITGGAPAVEPNLECLPSFRQCAGLVLRHHVDFLSGVFEDMGWLVAAIVTGLVLAGARRGEAVTWFCCGACFLVGHSLAFYWLPESDFRYAAYVSPFWYLVAIRGVSQVVSRIPFSLRATQILLIASWAALSLRPMSTMVREERAVCNIDKPWAVSMKEFATPLRDMTTAEDLVALPSGGMELCSGLFMDRPIVPLPQDRLDTMENNRRLIEVFHPRMILALQGSPMHQVAPAMNYRVCGEASLIQGRAMTIFCDRGPAR